MIGMGISVQQLEDLTKWADNLEPIICLIKLNPEGIVFRMLAPNYMFDDDQPRNCIKVAPWAFLLEGGGVALSRVAEHAEAEIRYMIDKEGRPRPTTERRVVR